MKIALRFQPRLVQKYDSPPFPRSGQGRISFSVLKPRTAARCPQRVALSMLLSAVGSLLRAARSMLHSAAFRRLGSLLCADR
jgi:hypothetical protein